MESVSAFTARAILFDPRQPAIFGYRAPHNYLSLESLTHIVPDRCFRLSPRVEPCQTSTMATSPPAVFSTSLPNAKKRPSISTQASLQNVSKKPKLHPLRQTSFPVDASGVAYGSAVTSARSETGSMTGSLLSATSAKRPRGRPRKSAQLQSDDVQASQNQDGDSANLTAGSANNARAGTRSVVSAKSGAADAEDDEQEEEIAELNVDEKDAEREAETRQYRLVGTFDEDQTFRYASWRRVKFTNSTLKKLVNATVSQSVGPAPLAAINHFSKYFIGEIVERARDVQIEFAKAYEKTREDEKKWRTEELQKLEERQRSGELDDHTRLLARDIVGLRRDVNQYIPNPHKGGLLPDHLREALRRYRTDGEGGGIGFEGLSHGLLGATGSAIWRAGDGAVGRRLFR